MMVAYVVRFIGEILAIRSHKVCGLKDRENYRVFAPRQKIPKISELSEIELDKTLLIWRKMA